MTHKIDDICPKTLNAVTNWIIQNKLHRFFVLVEEIVENDYDMSLNRYKDDVYDEVEYEAPRVILERLERIEGEISKEINELKGIL